jgi:transposase InsO family protein
MRPRSSYVRFCAQLLNELWQSDITCWGGGAIMSVIDDHSRLCVAATASTQVRAPDVVSTFYEPASRQGLPKSRLSDNGAVYTAAPRGGRCAIESELVALGIIYKHLRSYHPQTCGKVERFIRTMLAGWAYGAICRDSQERTGDLDGWLWYYNHRRRHSALGRRPLIARCGFIARRRPRGRAAGDRSAC